MHKLIIKNGKRKIKGNHFKRYQTSGELFGESFKKVIADQKVKFERFRSLRAKQISGAADATALPERLLNSEARQSLCGKPLKVLSVGSQRALPQTIDCELLTVSTLKFGNS